MLTNCKDLGVQLGLKLAKLKALEEYPEDQQKVKMILQWLEADQDATDISTGEISIELPRVLLKQVSLLKD